MLRSVLQTVAALSILTSASVALAGDIEVEHPFARASAGMATVGAAFMTLKNDGDTPDTLVSASSPVAAKTELHTHIKDGDIMRMREVPSIEVPADGTTVLQPGGLHVMLIDLKAPLKEGETFPLTLTFANAGSMTVEVPVKSPGAMAPMSGHMDHMH